MVFLSGISMGFGMLTSMTLSAQLGFKYTFMIGGSLIALWTIVYSLMCGIEFNTPLNNAETGSAQDSRNNIEFTRTSK